MPTRWIESFLEWFFGLLFRPLMKQVRRHARQTARSNPQAYPESLFNTYRVGDYQNSLALANIGEGVGRDMSVFKASLLMQLGQLDEAARIARRAVDAEKNPQLAALANCVLGEVYLFQFRYDQASDCFRTALNQWPERAATYRHLAEVCLRRSQAQEALDWARQAVAKERAGVGVTPETKAANLATDLAVLSLALAGSTRDALEVERTAQEAAGMCGGCAVSVVAQVNVYCGLARLLGNFSKSAEHFELAARVDPRGIWGREAQRLAAEALKTQ